MDRDAGPEPAGLDPQDLQEAIAQASRHLGVEGTPRPPAPLVLHHEPHRRRRAVRTTLAALLAAVAAGSAYLNFRPMGTLPPRELEEDLRWAVGRVVRAVEARRRETGRLPAPQELTGLLGRAVAYEPTGSTYRVVGERDGVRVEYDGSLPLDHWLALATYGGSTPPP